MMIKRMILINSANFDLADIDLSKELFFVGDNASVKTTTTRALHFLYNANGEKLGIPSTKDSFSKHYFPEQNSYIFYIFDDFFIFTCKRGSSIKRWFSKQKFNIDKIIYLERLVEYEQIIAYIKSASLFAKPDSIQAYTDIIYGKNRDFLDFCIAKIENYEIFLDLFNMIFNVDRAIVTSNDIKVAIQKSLGRGDIEIKINYDSLSKDLVGFLNYYHFYKEFDVNRNNLLKTLALQRLILDDEDESNKINKMINFRYEVEQVEIDKSVGQISSYEDDIQQKKERIQRFKSSCARFENLINNKIKSISKSIVQIEILKEKFTEKNIEEAVVLSSKYEILQEDLDAKKISLNDLNSKKSSKEQIIQKEIKELEYKKKTTIPNQAFDELFAYKKIVNDNLLAAENEIQNNFLAQKRELADRQRGIDVELNLYKNKIKNIEQVAKSDILKLKKNILRVTN